MKFCKPVLLLVLLMPAMMATAKLPPVRLQMGAGLSQPMFAYARPSLSKGCFTTSGLHLETGAMVKALGPWWWDVRYLAQLHPVDVGRLGYERVMADPFLVDTYIRSEPYRHQGLLTGPVYMLDKGSSWFAHASVLAGIMHSKTPHQLYKPTYFMTGPEYFEISSASDFSPVFGGEITGGWKATPCYHLKLSASFLQTNMDFRFRSALGLRTDSRSISTLNLSAAVVFLIPPR